MRRTYSREEIVSKAAEAAESMPTFYQQRFIQYTGMAFPEKVPYTEITAAFLRERPELWEQIPTIFRKSPYRTEGHNGTAQNPDSNQGEAHLAYDLYRQKQVPGLGAVLDYQVPLKDKQADKAGKIDLVADDGAALYLLELKREDSRETLLRCVLEILTYWHTVDREALVEDFLGGDAKRTVVPAVLLPTTCTACRELHELRMGERPQLAALMEEHGVQAFELSPSRTCCRD